MLGDVFDVVFEVFVDGVEFVDQEVGTLELLTFAGEVEVVELVADVGKGKLLYHLLEVHC